jgi:hypothetical protein
MPLHNDAARMGLCNVGTTTAASCCYSGNPRSVASNVIGLGQRHDTCSKPSRQVLQHAVLTQLGNLRGSMSVTCNHIATARPTLLHLQP